MPTPIPEHDLLAPQGDWGSCEVRYWCEVEDEGKIVSRAREHAQLRKGTEGQLRSRAMSLSQSRQRRHHSDTLGHWLHGEFGDLYVLKTSKDRFAAFLHGTTFYIVLGFTKKGKKAQTKDYRDALRLAIAARSHLEGGT